MSTQPRQSIRFEWTQPLSNNWHRSGDIVEHLFHSNIFGGGEEAADANLKRQQKAASDIFNQTAPMAAPAAQTSGKRLYQGQRDNDIFGIRERTTGEVRIC